MTNGYKAGLGHETDTRTRPVLAYVDAIQWSSLVRLQHELWPEFHQGTIPTGSLWHTTGTNGDLVDAHEQFGEQWSAGDTDN